MKKVRYAIGFIGAAPVLAAALPAGAASGPARPERSQLGAKSVRLNNAMAIPNNGCTGTKSVFASTGVHTIPRDRIQFWWASNGQGSTCIGTVKGQISNEVFSRSKYNYRVRVYDHGVLSTGSYIVGATCANGLPHSCREWKASVGDHLWYKGREIQVCEAWLYGASPSKGREAFTPLCAARP